ncbi:MAG: rod shape-determining protein MreC [Gallicola sp.]|nr:rod shape-determining protein MreC [Gallicola sp.]
MNKFNYNHGLRKWIIFSITVLLMMALIFITNQNRYVMNIGGNAIGTITSPFTRAIYVTSSKIGEVFQSVFGTRQLRDEYARLVAENRQLQERVNIMENVISREDFLEDEYKLMQERKRNYTTANISAKEPGNLFVHFTIDKGSKDGVNVGDTVVQGTINEKNAVSEGLVGKVIEVGLNWSKVASILDENNNVSSIVNRNGETGVIQGLQEDKLHGFMYNKEADVRSGDSIYTSGLGGIYPRDIYIGKVEEVIEDENGLLKNIKVKSPIDFNKLYRVLIINNGVNENEE